MIPLPYRKKLAYCAGMVDHLPETSKKKMIEALRKKTDTHIKFVFHAIRIK